MAMSVSAIERWACEHNRRWVGSTAPDVRCGGRRSGPRDPAAARTEHVDINGRRPRIGELLQGAGMVGPEELAAALREQARSGGRLGEILAVSGIVPAATLTKALARQHQMDMLRPEDEPVALLTTREARMWRAVALSGTGNGNGAVAVAVADARDEVLAQLEARLECPVH